MEFLRRRPGENSDSVLSDTLYAVKCLLPKGFLEVNCAMIRKDEWQLNVRSWEVKDKGLDKSSHCECITMDEYMSRSRAKFEPVKIEAEVSESAEELEEKSEDSEDVTEEEKPKKTSRSKRKRKVE